MAAKFLGQFLLEQGLIDRQQLLDALEAQRASNPLLGELAVAAGMLDALQAERINARQRSEDARFGDLALEMGLLDSGQVEQLLERQKAGRRMLGQILVEQGALTEAALQQALQAQRDHRDDAREGLDAALAGHPSAALVTAAIDTCTRLFPRLLKVQCQFSSVVDAAAGDAGCEVTAHVLIHSERPLMVAVGCDRTTMANIAGAFLMMPPGDCDDALAADALGELVNVLMGYIARDALSDDADYRATPPGFDAALPELVSATAGSLPVAMDSQLGRFVLVVAG